MKISIIKDRLSEWIEDADGKYAIPRMDLRNNGHSRCIQKLTMLEDMFELIGTKDKVWDKVNKRD